MTTFSTGFVVLLLAVSASMAGEAIAETSGRPANVGVEFQAYPAGVVPGVRWEQTVTEDWSLALRLGWNLTDRRDWGEHDDETGSGPGGGLSALRRFRAWGRSWRIGARVDLWWLDIDWEDDATVRRGPRSGRSEIVVLQPTAVMGLVLGSAGAWTAEATVAFGQEINVATDGEEVGEGPIALLGVTFLR